jgi:hypothetical protein
LSSADYLYTGTNLLQPLAAIEPATSDSLFKSWTGELSGARDWDFGVSSDFLRYRENTEDWDVIISISGARRLSPGLVVGLNLPYIIRDGEYNESGLLDLRGFLRKQLLLTGRGGGISGELNLILPTAEKGAVYPYTLDSAVAGFRLAVFSGPGELRMGVNAGYQRYLATESGEDSDTLYAAWLVKELDHPYSIVAEIAGSGHTHTGQPGDETVSDDYALVGILYEVSKNTDIGVAASAGISDSASDLRVALKVSTRLGREQSRKPPSRPAARVAKAVSPKDDILVVVTKGSGSRKNRKRVRDVLELKGYAVSEEQAKELQAPANNMLYFGPGSQEKAIRLSRLLVFGGTLESLDLKEVPKLPRDKMFVVLGKK